jgi:acyl carrier protein
VLIPSDEDRDFPKDAKTIDMGKIDTRRSPIPTAVSNRAVPTEQFMQQSEILERIRTTLVELFELNPAQITPEARLYEDLEIDSIDVVDLMDEVQKYTGRKVTPEDFRSVRTVSDLAAVMQRLMNA